MHDNGDEFEDFSDYTMVKSSLNFELIQRVFQLSGDVRVKLLAFLHLAEELHLVMSDLDVSASGGVALKLFNRTYQNASSQPDRESAVEPLQ
jgi:hypothetical protein